MGKYKFPKPNFHYTQPNSLLNHSVPLFASGGSTAYFSCLQDTDRTRVSKLHTMFTSSFCGIHRCSLFVSRLFITAVAPQEQNQSLRERPYWPGNLKYPLTSILQAELSAPCARTHTAWQAFVSFLLFQHV